jgi:hypothetical protein
MRGKRFLGRVLLLGLMLGAVASLSMAQGVGSEVGAAPHALLGTAFTYQGRLTDASGLVNDNCDFQFSLWDAAGSGEPPSGGTQIGATQTKTAVEVAEGLFTIPDLDFGGAAFDGQARWLQIAVRCPAGGGTYATLAPRQALTAAPYALYADLLDGQHASAFAGAAHTHLGETWTGSDNALRIEGSFADPDYAPLVLSNTGGMGLRVSEAGSAGVHVDQAGGHGVSVGSADQDGVYVGSAGRWGVAVDSAGADGVAVGSAGGDGLFVGSADLNGVLVDSAGERGLYVGSVGKDGLYVGSAGWDGVVVNSAGSDGVYVDSADMFGVHVSSAGWDGVYVGSADQDGVYVGSAGRWGVAVDSAGADGVAVGSAGGDGVYVYSAGEDGVHVDSAGGDGVDVRDVTGNGLRVDGAGLNGVEIWNATYDGVQVNAAGRYGVQANTDGTYGLYTPDSVYVGGKIDLVGTVDPVIGERFEVDPQGHYEVGDLLVIDPDSPYLVLSSEPNDTKVIGVVGPGLDYEEGELMVIVFGWHGANPAEDDEENVRTVAKIKADAGYGSIQRGDLLTTSPRPGYAMRAQAVDMAGVEIYRPGTIIGKALESLDAGQGLIEIFVVPQ